MSFIFSLIYLVGLLQLLSTPIRADSNVIRCSNKLSLSKRKIHANFEVLQPKKAVSDVLIEECFPSPSVNLYTVNQYTAGESHPTSLPELAFNKEIDVNYHGIRELHTYRPVGQGILGSVNEEICFEREALINGTQFEMSQIQVTLVEAQNRHARNIRSIELSSAEFDTDTQRIKVCWEEEYQRTNNDYFVLSYVVANATRVEVEPPNPADVDVRSLRGFQFFITNTGFRDIVWRFSVDAGCDLQGEMDLYINDQLEASRTVGLAHGLEDTGFLEWKFELDQKAVFKLTWHQGNECIPTILSIIGASIGTSVLMFVGSSVLWFLLLITQNVFRKKDSQDLKYYQLDYHMRKAIIPTTKEPVFSTFRL